MVAHRLRAEHQVLSDLDIAFAQGVPPQATTSKVATVVNERATQNNLM